MEFNYLDTQQQRKFLKFNQSEGKQNEKLFSNKSQLVSQKLPPIDSTTIHYQPFQPNINRTSFLINDTNDRQESFLTPLNSNSKNKKFGSRIPKITHNFYNLPEYSETIQSPEPISASNNHFRNKSINSRLSQNQLSLNQPQLNTSRTHKFEHELVQNLERPLFEKNAPIIKTPLNNQLDRRQTNQNLKLFRQQYNQHKPSNISTDNSNYSYQKLNGFISPPSVKTYLASDILDQMFTFKMPDLMPSKHSNKQNGLVKAFAANTHQGLVRNYNEDRVSIILNMLKPLSKQLQQGQEWPSCSFFGIYDGHGGNKCAEFLKENLHQYIIQDPEFPTNPKQAIMNACKLAENAFINKAQNSSEPDRSGSCATFILIVEDTCYSGNVGDSRIIASVSGNQCEQVTIDHKPNYENEKKRIINAGGHIYQTQAPKIAGISLNGGSVLGPHRVFPGRLSVLLLIVNLYIYRFRDLLETWRQNFQNMGVQRVLQWLIQKLLLFQQQILWISQYLVAMGYLINQQISKFLILSERKLLMNKSIQMCISFLEWQQQIQ